MKFEYHEELMKGKIIFTTIVSAILIFMFSLVDGEIFTIIALGIGVIGLAVVSFLIYTENRLGRIEFAIAHKALVIFYQESEFWIYYEDMEYIKETEFGIVIGLKGLVEELAILDRMDNYQVFLRAIFAKAKEYNIKVELLDKLL